MFHQTGMLFLAQTDPTIQRSVRPMEYALRLGLYRSPMFRFVPHRSRRWHPQKRVTMNLPVTLKAFQQTASSTLTGILSVLCQDIRKRLFLRPVIYSSWMRQMFKLPSLNRLEISKRANVNQTPAHRFLGAATE